MFPATDAAATISFNQLHKDTHNRIKMVTTDPELQPYSSFAQRLFYRLVESRYDGLSVARADAVVIGAPHSRYKSLQLTKPFIDPWNILGAGGLPKVPEPA